MDAERRAELIVRRQTMNAARRERAWRQWFEPALGAIEAAGTPHRFLRWDEEPGWQPGWIPHGYSSMPWSRLPLTIDVQLPPGEGAARAAELVRVAIAERAAPDAELRIMQDSMSLMLRRDDLFAHLEDVLAGGWEAWIAEPGRDWIIEADPYHVYLCERGFPEDAA